MRAPWPARMGGADVVSTGAPGDDLRGADGAPRLVVAFVVTAVVTVAVVLLAFAVTSGWQPIRSIDIGVSDHVHVWAVAHPTVVTAFSFVSDALAPWVLRAVAAGLVVTLVVRRKRRLALWIAVTALVGSLLGLAIKVAVGRARPSFADPVATAGGYAFPSGHALTSFVILGVAVLAVLPVLPERLRRPVWICAGCAVVLVGTSRVILGVHYVTDVVGAWVVGAGVLAVTTIMFDPWRRGRGN